MASINRYQTINDIPQSKGKTVLLKILNSPKADFSKLQQIATEYEKKLLKWWKLKARKKNMIFLPLETELFYYEHLFNSSDNLRLIQDFCISNSSGAGLERYIKELAESDEQDGSARTYLVKDKFTHELVAYFSLKTGLFTIDADNGYFYSISAVELLLVYRQFIFMHFLKINL